MPEKFDTYTEGLIPDGMGKWMKPIDQSANVATSGVGSSSINGGLGNYGTITDANGITTGINQGAYDALYGTKDTGYTMSKNDLSGGLGASGTPVESNSKAFGNYASGGAALGQMGLGVMSYLDQSKTADANRKLLGQQYDSNATIMANSAADRESSMKAFGV